MSTINVCFLYRGLGVLRINVNAGSLHSFDSLKIIKMFKSNDGQF